MEDPRDSGLADHILWGRTMNTATNDLRDLHAARFAEMAELRELLVTADREPGGDSDVVLTGRMRGAVAEILVLQRDIARLEK